MYCIVGRNAKTHDVAVMDTKDMVVEVFKDVVLDAMVIAGNLDVVGNVKTQGIYVPAQEGYGLSSRRIYNSTPDDYLTFTIKGVDIRCPLSFRQLMGECKPLIEVTKNKGRARGTVYYTTLNKNVSGLANFLYRLYILKFIDSYTGLEHLRDVTRGMIRVNDSVVGFDSLGMNCTELLIAFIKELFYIKRGTTGAGLNISESRSFDSNFPPYFDYAEYAKITRVFEYNGVSTITDGVTTISIPSSKLLNINKLEQEFKVRNLQNQLAGAGTLKFDKLTGAYVVTPSTKVVTIDTSAYAYNFDLGVNLDSLSVTALPRRVAFKATPIMVKDYCITNLSAYRNIFRGCVTAEHITLTKAIWREMVGFTINKVDFTDVDNPTDADMCAIVFLNQARGNINTTAIDTAKALLKSNIVSLFSACVKEEIENISKYIRTSEISRSADLAKQLWGMFSDDLKEFVSSAMFLSLGSHHLLEEHEAKYGRGIAFALQALTGLYAGDFFHDIYITSDGIKVKLKAIAQDMERNYTRVSKYTIGEMIVSDVDGGLIRCVDLENYLSKSIDVFSLSGAINGNILYKYSTDAELMSLQNIAKCANYLKHCLDNMGYTVLTSYVYNSIDIIGITSKQGVPQFSTEPFKLLQQAVLLNSGIQLGVWKQVLKSSLWSILTSAVNDEIPLQVLATFQKSSYRVTVIQPEDIAVLSSPKLCNALLRICAESRTALNLTKLPDTLLVKESFLFRVELLPSYLDNAESRLIITKAQADCMAKVLQKYMNQIKIV